MDLKQIKAEVDLIDYAKNRYAYNCDSKGRGSCLLHPPDNHNSFSIWKGDDSVWRFKCFHDGTSGTIVDLKSLLENINERESIRLLLNEFGESEERAEVKLEIEREHIYRSAEGKPIFKNVKYKPNPQKISWGFKHREHDKWLPGRGRHELIPYNLDKFRDHKEVIITEGEKDADTVMSLSIGLLATSAPNGKSSWPNSLTKYFGGLKDVTFIYDVGNDEDVLRHAAKLHAAFPGMKIYKGRVPMEKRESDISDYLSTQNDKVMAFLDVQAKAREIDFEELKENSERSKSNSDGLNRKGGDLHFVKAQNITAQRHAISWLWPNRIPTEMLTLIVGDPGTGKGLFGARLAAHVTTGEKWPDLPFGPEPSDVLIISTEDIFASILEPRLAAAGADLSRIQLCAYYINEKGEKENVDLMQHIPYLENKVKKMISDGLKPKLILMDPILSLLGSKVDDNRAIEVRSAITPLIRLAEETKTALVLVHHLSKDRTRAALYRPAGSHAWVALSRAVWAVAKDPDDIEENPQDPLRVLAPLKLNIAKDPGALTFTIDEIGLKASDNSYMSVPAVKWGEVCWDKNVETILGPREIEKKPGPIPLAQEEAAAFLGELFLMKTEIPSNEVLEAARSRKINEKTLKRAKKVYRYKSDKRKSPDGEEFWVWIRPF